MSGLKQLAANLRGAYAQVIANDVVLARGVAHAKFDLIWKKRILTRREAYAWLQDQMQMSEFEAHMERMNSEQCMQVVDHVNKAFPCLR